MSFQYEVKKSNPRFFRKLTDKVLTGFLVITSDSNTHATNKMGYGNVRGIKSARNQNTCRGVKEEGTWKENFKMKLQLGTTAHADAALGGRSFSARKTTIENVAQTIKPEAEHGPIIYKIMYNLGAERILGPRRRYGQLHGMLPVVQTYQQNFPSRLRKKNNKLLCSCYYCSAAYRPLIIKEV